MRQAILALAAAVDRNTEAVFTAVNRLAEVIREERSGKRKLPPAPPIKKKGRKEEPTTTPPEARARVRGEFAKPTAEEVAGHVRDMGYTFDPEEFWNFYESKGWRVGSHVMKSWQAACVVWQKKECRDARREARQGAESKRRTPSGEGGAE